MAALLSLRESGRNPRRRDSPALALFSGLGSRASAAAEPASTSDRDYLQYGLALAAEAVASPGGVCPPDSDEPLHPGQRSRRSACASATARGIPGTSEAPTNSPATIRRTCSRLAILQQFRAEGRFYFDRGNRDDRLRHGCGRLSPVRQRVVGQYGRPAGARSAWAWSSRSPPSTTIGCMALYRLLVPRRWVDSAGVERANELLRLRFFAPRRARAHARGPGSATPLLNYARCRMVA